jgi:hypothetical protein
MAVSVCAVGGLLFSGCMHASPAGLVPGPEVVTGTAVGVR